MELVAEAVCMQVFSDQHFRFGVFAFYPAHIVAAGSPVMHICHGAKIGDFLQVWE